MVIPPDPKRIAIVGAEPSVGQSPPTHARLKVRAVLGEFTTNQTVPCLIMSKGTPLYATTESRKLGWPRVAVGHLAAAARDRVDAMLSGCDLLITVGRTAETETATQMARARRIPAVHVL